VQAVRAATDGRKASGFINVGDTAMLAIVAPVCNPGSVCGAGPVAIVGIEVDALTKDAAGDLAGNESPAAGSPTAIALYGADGGLLASHGRPFSRSLPPGRSAGVHSGRVGAEDVATVFSPYEVQGRPVGTLAVSIPTEPARGGVRDAGVRLAVAVLAAVIGAAGIGALLSRRLVSQVRSLLDATRALGRGNLSARAVALGRDELGELVDGVNQTAEELQASYEMLEARVAQRTDEIQRLLQERTDFFTNMSHELRTPLALILAEAKLIEDPTYRKNAVWAKKTAAKLRVSTEQVLAVVNDILELAEADAGQLHVDVADVAVDEIVEELRPTIEGLAHAANLGVTFDVPPRMPAARADRRRVRDVVLNLVDNAVKYTPNGGTVSIGLSASNGSVAVEVSDNGIGVPPGVGDRLFEPFYRVETSRAQHGKESTGLGLAIAKRIVEAQGGALTYRSEPGNGSTFTMRLPRSTLGEQ
jgi:signal transduction histidine kinase